MADVSAHYDDVNTIINDCAVEVGLAPSTDAFADTNPAFRQLRYLMDSAGRKLLRMAVFQEMVEEHTISTDASATYALPDNWGYMIPQTNWNRTDDVPLFGPLSAQDWQFLEGRGLSSTTIYASFRLRKHKVYVYPSTLTGKTLAFEYVRDTWACDSTETDFYDRIQAGTNLVRYPPELFLAFLKCLFLEAKGFDSQKARDEFTDMFEAISGQDKSSEILNAGGNARTYPYLGKNNIPDSGYGS